MDLDAHLGTAIWTAPEQDVEVRVSVVVPEEEPDPEAEAEPEPEPELELEHDSEPAGLSIVVPGLDDRIGTASAPTDHTSDWVLAELHLPAVDLPTMPVQLSVSIAPPPPPPTQQQSGCDCTCASEIVTLIGIRYGRSLATSRAFRWLLR